MTVTRRQNSIISKILMKVIISEYLYIVSKIQFYIQLTHEENE